MKKLLLLPLALAFASNAAIAANSVDLRVTGTISPAACNVSLSNGGAFAFGEIVFLENGTTIGSDGVSLSEKSADLSVSCDSPTLVAIRTIDNKPETVGGPSANGPDFGLGTDSNGGNIGRYDVAAYPSGINIDGVAGYFTSSMNNGGTWNDNTNGWLVPSPDHLHSWNKSSAGSRPELISSVNQRIVVSLYIDKTDLDLSQPINLDGSASIELVYL